MFNTIRSLFKNKEWVYYDKDDKLKAKWGEDYLSRRCNNTSIVQRRVEYYMLCPERPAVLNLKWVTVEALC